ncbi:MAG: AMP nucleosidase [Geminicoccaceae bacterium]
MDDRLIEAFRRHGVVNVEAFHDAADAVQRITAIYEHGRSKIRDAFRSFADDPTFQVDVRSATYPFVGLGVDAERLNIDARLAFGALLDPGLYGTTVTRPDLFRHYLTDQLGRLIDHHKVPVIVGESAEPIPLPFVVEESATDLANERVAAMLERFTLPDLKRTSDDIANGVNRGGSGSIQPLALFTAERIDYSLHRLYHYTATAPNYFQRFILLTNYQRYVERFIEYGRTSGGTTEDFVALVEPGNVVTERAGVSLEGPRGEPPQHLPQMPAYHLVRSDGRGITLVDIGVGPSNARTMTDHLAVLRPHVWLMLGHCAGLRRSQQLGDYVLAHGYVRDDHVLDADLPQFVPVPPIAEVQVALQQAVETVTQAKGIELKTRMRTGTVATTDNRHWELRYGELYQRLNQSRAIAVDMESATIAANGFRFRVPYGTLLCVSDKPLHGELKLKGMANAFYRQRISQHLEIGIETCRILREAGPEQLHSRKLRSFDEPAFR